jgi:transcription termination factor NusB
MTFIHNRREIMFQFPFMWEVDRTEEAQNVAVIKHQVQCKQTASSREEPMGL